MDFKSFYFACKRRAADKLISDEEFLNCLIEPVVIAYELKNKNGEPLYLNKSRVSKILHGKDSLPEAVKGCLNLSSFSRKVRPHFQDFVEDNLDESELNELLCEIREVDENEKVESDSVEQLYISYVAALKKNDTNKEEGFIIYSDSVRCFSAVCGDVLDYGFANRTKKKNIIVVPVNTTFETKASWEYEKERYPLVSAKTIHGQWLARFAQSGEDTGDLKKRIIDSINKQDITTCEESKRYPIGTIAAIDSNNATYYLLAISSFDEKNKASSDRCDIENALGSLLSFYDTYGQGRDLYLPLIGSGRSRANMTPLESFNLLRSKLIKDKERIFGNILLVIKPEDMDMIERELTI